MIRRANAVVLIAAAVGGFAFAQEGPTILRVIVDSALVRSKPEFDAEVIGRVGRGALLEAVAQEGAWYTVDLPADAQERIVRGYIHESVVERVAPTRQEASPPPIAPVRPEGIEPRLRGFSLKFGLLTHPYAGSFGAAWQAALGFDLGLARNIALGVELQPSYHTFAEADFKVLSLAGYANLKAGTDLGVLAGFLRRAGVFAGVGAGAEAIMTSGVIESESVTATDVKPVFHILAGAGYRLGGVQLFAEYQMSRRNNPDVEKQGWRNYLLFGVKF